MNINIQLPLISIIVPVYNMEIYLRKCIDSILCQTYKNIELILVDDGSTDSSPQICDEYAELDDRVKVIHKHNTGQADSRNKGINIAKGEYIGFVDSDDWIDADMYEVLYNTIVDTGADISICGTYYEYKNKVEVIYDCGRTYIYDNKEAIKAVYLDSNIKSYSCDKLFKREIIANDYPDIRYFEDLSVLIKWIANANKIVVVGKAKYHYRQRLGSICTTQSNKNFFGFWIGLFNIFLFVREKEVFSSNEREMYLRLLRKTISVSKDIARVTDSKRAYAHYNYMITSLKEVDALRNEYLGTSKRINLMMLEKAPMLFFYTYKVVKKLHFAYKRIFTKKRIYYA